MIRFCGFLFIGGFILLTILGVFPYATPAELLMNYPDEELRLLHE